MMRPNPSSGSLQPRQGSSSSSTEGFISNGRNNPSSQQLSLMNFVLQNPQLLEQIKVDYFESILYDFLFEVAIDFLWSAKIGNTTLDDIYNCHPFVRYVNIPIKYEERKLPPVIARPPIAITDRGGSHTNNSNNRSSSSNSHQVVSSSSGSGGSSKSIYCPICNELVGAVRFAYHLEKCMNGGKRGTRKHYDYLRDDVVERPRPKKEFVDPFPDSMIVRIKLKNGVPYGNTRRIGVSLEEFQACQEEERQLANSGNSLTQGIRSEGNPFHTIRDDDEFDQDTIDSVP